MAKDADAPYAQISLVLANQVDDHIRNTQEHKSSYSRHQLAIDLGISYSALNNVLNGWRRPDATLLAHLAFLLSGGNEAEFIKLLGLYTAAYGDSLISARETLSRTHGIRTGRGGKPLHIGILQYSCWAYPDADRPGDVAGLIPDLLRLLTSSLGVQCEWSVLPLTRLVDYVAAGTVDIAAGYICQMPSRLARTNFVPLDFPAELGIQAITRAALPSGTTYQERKCWLDRAVLAGDLELELVEGELAWEVRHILFPPTGESGLEQFPFLVDPSGDVDRVIDQHWGRGNIVIVTDHVTAAGYVQKSQTAGEANPWRPVFAERIGAFHGGFLLPASDPEFTDLFRTAYHGLMTSRLPAVGETISRYAAALVPFLESSSLPNTNLSQWLMSHWPSVVPIPETWKILALTSDLNSHI